MDAKYVPDKGIQVTLQGSTKGITVILHPDMPISGIVTHLRELEDFLSET